MRLGHLHKLLIHIYKLHAYLVSGCHGDAKCGLEGPQPQNGQILAQIKSKPNFGGKYLKNYLRYRAVVRNVWIICPLDMIYLIKKYYLSH